MQTLMSDNCTYTQSSLIRNWYNILHFGNAPIFLQQRDSVSRWSREIARIRVSIIKEDVRINPCFSLIYHSTSDRTA